MNETKKRTCINCEFAKCYSKNKKQKIDCHKNDFALFDHHVVDTKEAEKLIRDAKLLEEAGCFAIVIEKVPAALAERVAKELTIPVIGIGAGGGVDGQVLVVTDMLGMTNGFSPRFLRRYADLYSVMTGAISQYVEDVKNCDFPNEKEQY